MNGNGNDILIRQKTETVIIIETSKLLAFVRLLAEFRALTIENNGSHLCEGFQKSLVLAQLYYLVNRIFST